MRLTKSPVAPSRGRGLKLGVLLQVVIDLAVAPSRGRGLKRGGHRPKRIEEWSPLHGGVD